MVFIRASFDLHMNDIFILLSWEFKKSEGEGEYVLAVGGF